MRNTGKNAEKNNVAARRSREARRLKENQISLRTAFLEQQNSSLKSALTSMTEKNEKLSQEKKALIEKLKKKDISKIFYKKRVLYFYVILILLSNVQNYLNV